MKTSNNPKGKDTPVKPVNPETEIKNDPMEKQENEKKKDKPEIPEMDQDSTTPDPTQPDTETSHRKKHKIGFDTTKNKKI